MEQIESGQIKSGQTESGQIESGQTESGQIESKTDGCVKNIVENKIYPFIDEMVDVFYTENCNSMIKQAIETESDKKTFLMFVMMYFGIHLKLENENDEMKKQQIKILLTDFIRDPEKRKCCIEMFETKFNNSFLESSSKDNKNLLIKDN
jgi:hypothetical protein